MGEESGTIIAGIILLLLGVAASIIITEAMGRPDKDVRKVAKLKTVHRVMALLFAVLFVLFSRFATIVSTFFLKFLFAGL